MAVVGQARLPGERAGATLYLRFGEIPRAGRSADWKGKSGSLLAGVSAFKAQRTADGEIEADVSSDPRLVFAFFAFSRMPLDAFLIEGREVGTGNCGEPLLADVAVVEKLSPSVRIRHSGLRLSKFWDESRRRVGLG